jgi:hypothetical protein
MEKKLAMLEILGFAAAANENVTDIYSVILVKK